ncbi:leucine-rich repeat-containing protein [Tanacetum coccineum]
MKMYNIYFYFMHTHILFILSLVLLLFNTTTAAPFGHQQLVAAAHVGATRTCIDKERQALLDFKAPLQDPDNMLSTWTPDEEDDCCQWSGVWCKPTNSLTFLDLSENKFCGVIPMSIGSLTKLTLLNLSDNSFYGTIPREFGNLTNLQYLHLYSLGSCRVENLDWLSSLSSLKELKMDGTSLAKANNWVNVIIGLQNLYYLSLVGCDLSHVMHPYSSSVNSSSSITELYLQKNNLNSSMYSWLCPLFGKKLELLVISGNTFDGNLSDFLNTLSTSATTLATLDASDNQFTGSLSGEIQNFSFLKELNLSLNQLSGTISDKLWQLPNLQRLYLSFNNISGKLPKSLSNHDLDLLDLSFNFFYGPIPAFPAGISFLDLSRNKFDGGLSFLCQLYGYLESLDISHNTLTGQLPDCFRNLTNLEVLNLGHNILSGRIPPSIGYLGQLETLCLYNNSFSGELPLNLKNCTELSLLDLGANILYGNIPVWLGKNMSRLYALSLKSNNLFGTIPSQICQLESLQILDLSFNNLHGTIPPCVNNLTSMVQKGFFLEQNKHHYGMFINHTGVIDYSYIDHLLIEWQGKNTTGTPQLQTFNASAYIGNAGLCGRPLPNKCPGDEDLGVPPVGESDGDEGKYRIEFKSMVLYWRSNGFATAFWDSM